MLFLCWGKREAATLSSYIIYYIFVKNHILNMFTVKTGISLRSASPWVVRPKNKKKKKKREEEEERNSVVVIAGAKTRCGTTFL